MMYPPHIVLDDPQNHDRGNGNVLQFAIVTYLYKRDFWYKICSY